MNFSAFIGAYRDLLYAFAEIVVYTLELIGILIVIVGSVKALIHLIGRLRHPRPFNVFLDLGRSLALALEFKMGAEIINTVIVHDIRELVTLGLVILVRALLAIIIHWEIKMERQSEKEPPSGDTKKDGQESK